MVDPFQGVPYSFGALRKTFGPLYVRCDLCRRFALLHLGRHGLRDVDYRSRTFSCSRCGSVAALAISDPRTELGLSDFVLDQQEEPQHHPAAVRRLSGQPQRREVSLSGGELPGRKVDGRR
jgi:hypothetical protein